MVELWCEVGDSWTPVDNRGLVICEGVGGASAAPKRAGRAGQKFYTLMSFHGLKLKTAAMRAIGRRRYRG